MLKQWRKVASEAASSSSNTQSIYDCTCDSTSLEHDCQCSAELTDLNSLIDSIVEMLETTRVNMSTAVLRACQTAHGPARFQSTSAYQAPHTASTNGDTIKYTRKQYRADVEAAARVDAHTRRHVSGIVNLAVLLPDAADLDNHNEVGLVLHKLATEIAVICNKMHDLQREQIGHEAAESRIQVSTNAQSTPTAVTAAASVDVLSSALKQNVQEKLQLQPMHKMLVSMQKLAKTLQRSSVFLCRTPELVLVSGGSETRCDGAILRLVPDQSYWTQVSSLLTPRYQHAAATLNENIIVAGGCSSNDNVLTSVEQFQTRSNTTTTLASLQVARRLHALVSTGGSVYALGGFNEEDSYLRSVEQYSAENNEWAFCANFGRGRCFFAAVACGINNSIVIAGGVTEDEDEASSSCELYNPLLGSMSIASLNLPRVAAVAACLAGNVYVFGGGKQEELGLGNWDRAEQYSIESNTWTLISQRMLESRSYFAASCLNEKVYLIGGVAENTVEVYDCTKDSFELTSSLPYQLSHSAATAAAAVRSSAKPASYNDSAIYVIGGNSRRPSQSLVAIEPTENLCFELSSMLVPRYLAASTVIQNKFYVSGGWHSSNKRLDSVEVFDIETNKWTLLPSLHIARSSHTLAVLGDTIFAIGGEDGLLLDSVEKFAIGKANNKWTKAPALELKRDAAASIALEDVILVIGGRALIDNEVTRTSSCEMYFPEIGSVPIGSLVLPRENPSAAKHDNSVYVVGGGEDDLQFKSVEQYNAATDQWTLVEKLPYFMIIHERCFGFNGCNYLYCSKFNTTSSSCVKSYDPKMQSFKHVTKLPFKRMYAEIGCVSLSEEKLQQLLNSVESRKDISDIAGVDSNPVVGKSQRSESKFIS